MRTAAERAWVAGVIEGEGCFTLNRMNQRRYQYPRLCVYMTDLDVLETLRELTGLGRVTGPYREGTNGWKKLWHWNVNGYDAVRKIVMAIYPWLHDRRLIQAANVLAAPHGRVES